MTSFQDDLGTVSAEIESLQNRSIALNTKLGNRKCVEKLLGPALEEVSISPAVVRKLSEDSIDQDWVAALNVLEKRSRAIDQRLNGPEKILAASDLKPLLKDLTNLVRILALAEVPRLTLSSRLSGYVTSSSLRSKLYGLRTSIHRSSNNALFLHTKTSLHSCQITMLSWPRRYCMLMLTQCVGTI